MKSFGIMNPLNTDLLLSAYSHGIFPMAVNDAGEIEWFSPDPRAIIPLDERFHVRRSLRRVLRQHQFHIRIDTAFEAVIRACSTAHGSTWISDEIQRAYVDLHRQGHAHSVECWRDGRLAGGLYGVTVGAAFCGESMFHYDTDASKVALVALVGILRANQFRLLDTQWTTPHLKTFGAMTIPRTRYLQLLHDALGHEPIFPDHVDSSFADY